MNWSVIEPPQATIKINNVGQMEFVSIKVTNTRDHSVASTY